MKNYLSILTIAVLLLACSKNEISEPAEHGQYPEAYKHRIDSLFVTYKNRGDFMGSVAFFRNGKTIYTNAIGFDDVENKRESTPDTKYRIGSISKTFTAALILMAEEEHKLSLKQTIDPFFPSVKNAKSITISNLLNHRSGIHSFTRDKEFFSYHTKYKSPREMLEIISNYDSDFTPDSRSEYSNSNYLLLSQILEKIYGSNFEDILKEKILLPLHLRNTYHSNTVNVENKESYSYKYTTTGWSKLPETNMSVAIGSGSIVSTSSDLAKFMDALFNEKILSSVSLKKMKTIQDGYGMGIMKFSFGGREAYGHHGSIDGCRSVALYFPEQNLSIALTSNGSNDNKGEILTEILKQFYDDELIEISEEEVKKYVGTYFNPDDKSDKLIFLNNKNVLIHSVKGEFEETLVYKGNRQFLFDQVYAESMVFTFSPDGRQLTLKQGEYEGVFYKE